MKFLMSMRGSTGRVVIVVLFASFFVLALEPFRFRSVQRNHAEVMPDKVICFPESGLLRTHDTPEWMLHAIEKNQLRIDLRVRPGLENQAGPAPILTVSRGLFDRNLTIAQEGADLIVRLRTVATDDNGLPPDIVPRVFSRREWRTISVRIGPNSLHISVDEQLELDVSLPARPMDTWDRAFPLILGNELTADRPLLGEILWAKAWVEGEEKEIFLEEEFIKPTWYVPGCEIDLVPPPQAFLQDPALILDAILNFVSFVPLGFLLMVRQTQPRRLLLAVAPCVVASFCVEVVQVFMDTHYPSAVDFVTNSGGAFLGAWLATRVDRRGGERGQQAKSSDLTSNSAESSSNE